MIFKEQFKVQLKDIGKDNYLKNIGILEIFENIATHHSDIAGYGPNDIEKVGVSWVLMDWKLKVIKRPKYGQVLNVNTWARTIGGQLKKTYTYRDFEMYDEQGQLCVIGTSKWVLVNIDTGKITKIEDDIMLKYNLEDKNVFNEDELDKIKVPETYSNEISYKVNRKDIDINGHMHNLYYLDLAYEALPAEVYENRPFDNVRIQYKNEIKYGEIVKCRYTFEENQHIISISDENIEKIHAVIIIK
jgi:medium-chain acyl-[acyl-carrier-protein] hydrolase